MIYRFKVWFDDDDEIIRWIDMKPNNTFKDFHTEILKSIEFEDKEPASFFMTNDRWIKGFEITLEDMGFDENDEPKTLMKDCMLKHYINDPHQKFIYINDFLEMWTLHVELQNILEESANTEYPRLHKSEGKAPKQKVGAGKFLLLDDLEFDNLAEELIKEKGGRISDIGDIEELLAGELDDEDEDDDLDNDEFGPEYGDGLDESDGKDLF